MIIYTTIYHQIRNDAGLTPLDYCILDTIYQLSNSGKESYSGWCNAAKSSFSHLAKPRTIINRFNALESAGWLEFKDEKRFLKRTTKKYYQLVFSRVQKLRGEKVAPVQNLHGGGEKVAPLGVKKLHGGGEKVAPNKNNDNNRDNNRDNSFLKKEKELLARIEELEKQNLKFKQDAKRKKVAPKKENEAPDIAPMPGFEPKHENAANMPSKKYQQELQGFKFPAHWSPALVSAFLAYCDSMDFKKDGKWGTMNQLKSEIRQINSHLVKNEMEIVTGAIQFAADKGNTTYNIQWHKNRMKNERTNESKKHGDSTSAGNENIFEAFEEGLANGCDKFGESDTDFEIPVQEFT